MGGTLRRSSKEGWNAGGYEQDSTRWLRGRDMKALRVKNVWMICFTYLVRRVVIQKLDQERMLSRGPAGALSVTVTPRLVVRMGRSARRPWTGFMKHQAGIAPSSTSPGLNTLSRPTMHQPSSKEFTTSTSKDIRSRGNTGTASLGTYQSADHLTI